MPVQRRAATSNEQASATRSSRCWRWDSLDPTTPRRSTAYDAKATAARQAAFPVMRSSAGSTLTPKLVGAKLIAEFSGGAGGGAAGGHEYESVGRLQRSMPTRVARCLARTLLGHADTLRRACRYPDDASFSTRGFVPYLRMRWAVSWRTW